MSNPETSPPLSMSNVDDAATPPDGTPASSMPASDGAEIATTNNTPAMFVDRDTVDIGERRSETAKLPEKPVETGWQSKWLPANTRNAPVLRYFAFDHLPAHLQAVSKPFHDAAHALVALKVHDEDERGVALRKLLEAKDAAVRSVVAPR